jgi:chorismate mutase-like protein
MNIPFLLRDESRNDAFLAGAKAQGLLQLKGHKSVGGMRASLYNAMPLEGVQALVAYMRAFEKPRPDRPAHGDTHMTDPKPASTGPVQSEALGTLRVQIDAIDQQLLSLLNQRALVAEQVGEIKRAEGSPFFRPDRVAQVIDKIQRANQGPLLNQHVASIWREIMSACLALEAPQRVAVLGPQGTFCEEAAIEYFGSAANLIYCANFDEVFHATAAGTAQYGVVGMENSTEGVVARSLDLFLRSPVHVVGEVSLLVRHNLLRQTNALDGIEVVMAHPQALAQCQNWLSAHLPNAERRAVSSNAEGAAWRPATPAWAAWPANAQRRSSGCTSSRTPFRTRPTTAPALP